MTSAQLFLAPVFLHFALFAFAGLRNMAARVNALRSGRVRLADIALDGAKWPEDVRKLGNSFNNQYELPLYWYALSGLVLATLGADRLLIALAWAFVATRLVHYVIHTGSNDVPRRFYAYLAGFSVLVVMWVWFALRFFWLG